MQPPDQTPSTSSTQEQEESEEEGEDSELARNMLLNAAPQTSDFNPDSGDASGDVSGDVSPASSGSRPDTPGYSHSSGSLPGTPGSIDHGLEPSWPDSQDSYVTVMSEVARPSVIEMHRCLRDKNEQLQNALQEILRIRREHAIELASTRHDSESMASQAFQLRLQELE